MNKVYIRNLEGDLLFAKDCKGSKVEDGMVFCYFGEFTYEDSFCYVLKKGDSVEMFTEDE